MYLEQWRKTHNPRQMIPKKWRGQKFFTDYDALKIVEGKYGADFPALKPILEKFHTDKYLELLARMWILARYDDKGVLQEMNEEIRRARRKGERSFYMIEGDEDSVVIQRRILGLSVILTLLAEPTHEMVSSMIFDEPLGLSDPPDLTPFFWVMNSLMIGAIGIEQKSSESGLPYSLWPQVQKQVLEVAALLDGELRAGRGPQLFYLGELLTTSMRTQHGDGRGCLVTLCSVLEFLLTHHPDTSRFNVEDSISRQFRFKGALLRYLTEGKTSSRSLKKRS